MPLRPDVQERLKSMNAISLAQTGYDKWAAKPHNAKWVRKIDGTPIANDIVVCIAEEIVRELMGGGDVARAGVRVFETEKPE